MKPETKGWGEDTGRQVIVFKSLIKRRPDMLSHGGIWREEAWGNQDRWMRPWV
jgi:hypothetical protein